MIYKEYGNTGKKLSVIGFGGMRFKKEDTIEKAAEIVCRAGELGINYFDTAHSYCNNRSEVIFGQAFKYMSKPFYVSTKSMPKLDPTADHLRRRLEMSLKTMGVEKIHFFHIWCILNMEHYREAMVPGGPYEGALKAKEEGLIDHIVFSTHCSGEDIESIVNQGYFEGITLGYNILNFPYREKGLKAAYEKNMGVVVMNPLGGGIIPQNPDRFKFLVDRKNKNETVVQSALKFLISHKEITTALTGISAMKELEENVKAAENEGDMDKNRADRVKAGISKELNELCTGCKYCDECPHGIDIPAFMDSYNMFILEQSPKAIKNRLKWHWGIAGGELGRLSRCVECGRCEELCTQRLSIIDRLKEIEKLSN